MGKIEELISLARESAASGDKQRAMSLYEEAIELKVEGALQPIV